MTRVLIKETNRKVRICCLSFSPMISWKCKSLQKLLKYKSTLRMVSYNVNNAAFGSSAFLTLLSDLREDLFSFFLLCLAPEI